MVALSLAGCAVSVPSEDLRIGFRNPTVPFGGASRFDANRFAGAWATMACLGRCAREVRYGPAADGSYLREAAGQTTSYLVSAPGILRAIGSQDRLVVMWVDEGFRTAVVGDADGRWAAILNRGRKPAPDRIKAATEILDFNGWDISKLRKIM